MYDSCLVSRAYEHYLKLIRTPQNHEAGVSIITFDYSYTSGNWGSTCRTEIFLSKEKEETMFPMIKNSFDTTFIEAFTIDLSKSPSKYI